MADTDISLARGLAALAAEVDPPEVDVAAVIVAARARDRRRTSVVAVFGAVVVVAGLVAAVIGLAGAGAPRPGKVDQAAVSLAGRYAAQLSAAWPGIAPPGTRTTVVGGDDDRDPRTIPMHYLGGTGMYRAQLMLEDAKGSTKVTITVEPDPARRPPSPRCGRADGCAFRTFADGTAATVAIDGLGNHLEALRRDGTYVTVLEQVATRQGFLLDTERMFELTTVFTTPR